MTPANDNRPTSWPTPRAWEIIAEHERLHRDFQRQLRWEQAVDSIINDMLLAGTLLGERTPD